MWHVTYTCTRHVLAAGLTHTQEKELSELVSKVGDTVEESSRIKKGHNQMEKDNASLNLSVKSLQKKHQDLHKQYSEAMREVREARKMSSSSREQVAIAGMWVWHVGVVGGVHGLCEGGYLLGVTL